MTNTRPDRAAGIELLKVCQERKSFYGMHIL